MATRICPYCEHPNDAAAKFCVACGAVMHLAPCPHCGAVNHINVSNCYRCGGELPGPGEAGDGMAAEATAAPEVPPAAATQEPAPEGEKTGAADAARPAPFAPDTDAKGHPSLAVMFIILVAFGATGYFAYKQRTAASATEAAARKGPPAAVPEKPVAEQASAVPGTAPVSAPLVATPPASAPAIANPPAAEEKKEAAAQSSGRPGEPATRAKPASKPPASAKPVTPCTEAVAALGLCKPDGK